MKKRINALVITAVVMGPTMFHLAPASATAGPDTATVNVDCPQNKIQRALERHPNVETLIVEIRGMCDENVVLTRDRVTLRGADPASDGIRAVTALTQIDAALWVRGARNVTVQNLKLTGGYTGLLATEVSTPQLSVLNSRLEGNSFWGVTLEATYMRAEDTFFGSNPGYNAGVFDAATLACTRCTLIGTGARGNLIGLSSARVLFFDSSLSSGSLSGDNSSVLLVDSTIDAPVAPHLTLDWRHSQVTVTRVQIGGAMRLTQGSYVQLQGVTQSASPVFNLVDGNTFVSIADASPALGGPPSIQSSVLGFSLRNFSNASLLQTSQIVGNLNCSLGANAVCPTPANISGITSGCSACIKP